MSENILVYIVGSLSKPLLRPASQVYLKGVYVHIMLFQRALAFH